MDPLLMEPVRVIDMEKCFRESLLELMVRSLSSSIKHVPPGRLLQAVLQRERQCPTVVSPLLAMPHARLSELKGFYVVLARCPRGVDFGPGKKIELICLILGPEGRQKQYLQVLASLLRLFKHKEQKMIRAKPAVAAQMIRSAILSQS